jgi:hypothetical protein
VYHCDVPTVLVIGPYRFFFYSNEYGEPPHIHVQRDSALAKFWLSPVALARSRGFAAQELTRISLLVVGNRAHLEERWNEYFGH